MTRNVGLFLTDILQAMNDASEFVKGMTYQQFANDKKALQDPDEIRRSRIDPDVYLYYKRLERLFCSVARHEGADGFLITAYPTEKVKEGEIIWTK